jgi:hypothetical protein
MRYAMQGFVPRFDIQELERRVKKSSNHFRTEEDRKFAESLLKRKDELARISFKYMEGTKGPTLLIYDNQKLSLTLNRMDPETGHFYLNDKMFKFSADESLESLSKRIQSSLGSSKGQALRLLLMPDVRAQIGHYLIAFIAATVGTFTIYYNFRKAYKTKPLIDACENLKVACFSRGVGIRYENSQAKSIYEGEFRKVIDFLGDIPAGTDCEVWARERYNQSLRSSPDWHDFRLDSSELSYFCRQFQSLKQCVDDYKNGRSPSSQALKLDPYPIRPANNGGEQSTNPVASPAAN